MYFMVCVYGDNGEEKFFPELNRLGAGVELQSYGLRGIVSAETWEKRFALHSRLRPGITGRVAVHAPFIGISYDNIDCLLIEAVRKRMDLTRGVVEKLKPDTLVIHSGVGHVETKNETGRWLDAVTGFWREEMKFYKRLGTRVVLENTVEKTPELLAKVAEILNDESFGLCLDTGHANLTSDLKLSGWVKGMGRWLRHVHLHDNNGKEDEHLPVGEGNIDFAELFGTLSGTAPDVTLSLEVGAAPGAVMKNLRAVRELAARFTT